MHRLARRPVVTAARLVPRPTRTFAAAAAAAAVTSPQNPPHHAINRRLFSPQHQQAHPLLRANSVADMKDVKDRGLSLYEFDAEGNMHDRTIPKALLLQKYKLQARDVVLLEGFSRRDHPYLQVRHNCILVVLGAIRAVVFRDRVLLLKPPPQRQQHGERVLKFATRLSHVLHKSGPFAEPERAAGYVWDDDDAPFADDEAEYELRAIECMLNAACLDLRMQSRLLIPIVEHIVDSLNHSHGAVLESALFLLPPTKDALSRFELDTSLIRNVLSDLLRNDDDMQKMRLSLRHTQPLREEEAHRQVELILEAYCSQMVELTQEAYYQRKKLEGAQSVVELTIDARRNQILQLSLMLSIASVCVGTSAVVVGAFGMNVANGLETAGVGAFVGICASAVGVAGVIGLGLYTHYARNVQSKRDTARPFEAMLDRVDEIDALIAHSDKLSKAHFAESLRSMGVPGSMSELVWKKLAHHDAKQPPPPPPHAQ